MITKLTEAQTARFAEFRDKWIAIGLDTRPANREQAERGVKEAYRIAGLPEPKRIVWCGSPLSNGLTRSIVFGLKPSELKSVRASVMASVMASVGAPVGDSVRDSVMASVMASVRDSVGASVWASVGASVWASVGASVWASVGASVWVAVGDSVRDSVRASVRASVWVAVGDSVRDSVRDSVWVAVGDSVWVTVGAPVRASVWASVRDSVRAAVGASVRDSVRAAVGASVRDSVAGQHEAGWLSFYDYFRIVCELDSQTQKLCGLWQVAQSAGWWLPHANICWISERHHILHRNQQGLLHKDGGPALSYPDGFSIWALNGVLVKEEYALTPGEQIDPKTVLAETNVEIRRELLRKVGIERFLSKAKHKVLHTRGTYALLSVELSAEMKDARYLKMVNPSIGCFHVEGVHPTCDTVEHALNWRATQKIDQDWNPSVLT